MLNTLKTRRGDPGTRDQAVWIDLLDPTPSAFIPLGIFKWRNWI